jgi:HK97 gp10 family phage protein
MANKWNDAKVMEHIKQRVIDKLTLIGEFVEGDAKLRCPVYLGNLRNSINHKVDEEELSVTIGTNVEYAPYVEFGTGEYAEDGNGRKGGWFVGTVFNIATHKATGGFFTLGNKPQPFLRPALIENKKSIKTILNL